MEINDNYYLDSDEHDRTADQSYPILARLDRKRQRWQRNRKNQPHKYVRTIRATLVGKAFKKSSPFTSGHVMVDRGDPKAAPSQEVSCTNEVCTSSLVCTCSQVQTSLPSTPEEGDLMDFKQDVPYILNKKPSIVGSAEKMEQASDSSQQLIDNGDQSVNHNQDDLIDFKSDLVWQKGHVIPHNFEKSPQVKRKLEHPEMKIVTAHLVKTCHGLRIIVKGTDDVTTLSDNQIAFIKDNMRKALIEAQFEAQKWGEIPPTQVTFQLGIG